jgi:hypothetical protein
MASEPQKQSEEMLRAWILKRRDAAGPRFEPHPATRELLLAEVRRFHAQAAGQPEPEVPESFRDFLSLLFPRLAVGLAIIAVAGIAIWLISPQLAHNPTYTFAFKADRSATTPAERPVTLSAPTSAATDALVGRGSRRADPSASTPEAQDETAKKKDAEVFQRLTRKPSLALAESQPTVGGRLRAAKSVADNKKALLEKEVLKPGGAVAGKEEVESRFGAVVASGPAGTTAAYAPASPPAPAGTSALVATNGAVSLGLNEPKKPEAKPAEGAPAYSYGLDARADKAPASTASSDRLFKSSSVALRSELTAADTPAFHDQLKLRDETNALAETPVRLNGSAAAQKQVSQNIAIAEGNMRPIAVAVQRFIQISSTATAFEKQAARSVQNLSANQSFANNAAISNAANTFNGVMNQTGLGLLQRFDLEQNGSRISLVDADGSVYTGEWISADMDTGRANGQMNQVANNFASNNRQQGGGGLGGLGGNGNGAAQQYAPPRLQVYFHADGINQTLRQSVSVRGFLELATTAPVMQNTQLAGTQALNITRIQAQVATSTNTSRDIQAVPVKP